MATAKSLVENVLQLISLPEIYLRLQQVIDDPDHTRDQVAEILSYDPSLSARILRIANSSYYGFPREIESVASAVGIIGEIDLRNLVLATSVAGSMNALSYRGVNIDDFWLHSLRCGITARLIAKAIGGFSPETLFLAGILHDLGILVIYQHDATLAAAISRQIDQQHQLRDQAERELLGFDHAEVGALLLEAWGLSAELAELVRCHHQYQLAQDNKGASLMLALANLMAQDGPAADIDSDPRLAAMIGQLEISPDTLGRLVQDGGRQCDEVKNIILG
ncbi:MAG: HDOD domain-containing protein [Gammaproteobacteria bacterium]|jgi:HD-like signal output (HDOD) protein|nr:HDOD domain-containing protein [Gammaproteobacteria bacterium]